MGESGATFQAARWERGEKEAAPLFRALGFLLTEGGGKKKENWGLERGEIIGRDNVPVLRGSERIAKSSHSSRVTSFSAGEVRPTEKKKEKSAIKEVARIFYYPFRGGGKGKRGEGRTKPPGMVSSRRSWALESERQGKGESEGSSKGESEELTTRRSLPLRRGEKGGKGRGEEVACLNFPKGLEQPPCRGKKKTARSPFSIFRDMKVSITEREDSALRHFASPISCAPGGEKRGRRGGWQELLNFLLRLEAWQNLKKGWACLFSAQTKARSFSPEKNGEPAFHPLHRQKGGEKILAPTIHILRSKKEKKSYKEGRGRREVLAPFLFFSSRLLRRKKRKGEKSLLHVLSFFSFCHGLEKRAVK